MNRRLLTVIVVLVLATIAAPLATSVLRTRGAAVAEAALTPYGRLAADSAHGDSLAFASLPGGLENLLDVRDLIAPAGRAALPMHECFQMRGVYGNELRRRLHLRLGDTTAVVLYAAADRTTGTLSRVEFVRRTPRVGQRALVWEADRDLTISSWWFETARGGLGGRERAELPHAGPVPRALRALGRQLLTVACADSSPNSPMKPISGSRD